MKETISGTSEEAAGIEETASLAYGEMADLNKVSVKEGWNSEKYRQLREAIAHIQSECEAFAQDNDAENPYVAAFLKHRNIESLSRGLLVELVNAIYVHQDKSIEIEFHFADQYRRIAKYIENNEAELCEDGGKAGQDVAYQ